MATTVQPVYKDERTQGSPVQYCNGEGVLVEFPMSFMYHVGLWLDLFDRHADYIIEEIEQQRASGHRIIYLSCAISTRGARYQRTNLEIAEFIEEKLNERFGKRFWVLNPGRYQMESKQGTGLIHRHARLLSAEKSIDIDIERLARSVPIIGGDYLRMWGRVLCEDDRDNLGDRIDAFYFLGPENVRRFFLEKEGKDDLTDAIWSYFFRNIIVEGSGFQAYFRNRERWQNDEEASDAFLDAYTLKTGTQFSRGSLDEQRYWQILNQLRIGQYGTEAWIAGYYNDNPAGVEALSWDIPNGYAVQ